MHNISKKTIYKELKIARQPHIYDFNFYLLDYVKSKVLKFMNLITSGWTLDIRPRSLYDECEVP